MACARVGMIALLSGGKILLLRRRPSLRLLGGFRTFPGAIVRPGDAVEAAGPFADREVRVAALRGLFRETGLLLAGKRGGRRRVGAPPRGAGRRGLFYRLTGVEELGEAAGRLAVAGRWVTPPSLRVPIDVSVYLAETERPEAALSLSPDIAEASWVAPDEAIARWETDEWLIAPPLLALLRALREGAGRARARKALLDDPEASGEPMRRLEIRKGLTVFPMKTDTIPPATHTNAFLLGEREMLLVDPGSSLREEQQALLAHIEKAGHEGRVVREIVLTHHHSDHTGAAHAIRRALSVPVAAHAATAHLLRDRIKIDWIVSDGEEFDLGGPRRAVYRAIHTPGHSPGHLALFEKRTKTLLSGDLVLAKCSALINPPEGNIDHYLESLRRLKHLGASILIGAHGGVIGSPGDAIERCIAHRLGRERRIVESLEEGPLGIAEIVERVYGGISPALRPYAARSALAHLIRLVRLGVCEEKGGKYRRIGP